MMYLVQCTRPPRVRLTNIDVGGGRSIHPACIDRYYEILCHRPLFLREVPLDLRRICIMGTSTVRSTPDLCNTPANNVWQMTLPARFSRKSQPKSYFDPSSMFWSIHHGRRCLYSYFFLQKKNKNSKAEHVYTWNRKCKVGQLLRRSGAAACDVGAGMLKLAL